MSEKRVRIGGASGAWGDSPGAIDQLLGAGVDYLMMDYLAAVSYTHLDVYKRQILSYLSSGASARKEKAFITSSTA